MISLRLQELIHKFEEGAGARIVRWVFIAALFAGIALLYDVLCFRNFSTPQAMDSAQLARNIGAGRGFTTDYVRPFSMFLVSRHRADRSSLVKGDHPDLENPPLYPLLLAPVLKAVPGQDMAASAFFTVAHADFIVAVVNQLLLLLCLALVYRLARRWFDTAVATVAAIVFALTELYWRFSVSGLSTNLAMLFLLALVWALVRMEERNREESTARTVAFAALAGVLLGCLGMTRYAAAWLFLPVLLYISLFLAPRRMLAAVTLALAFSAVMAPWIVRNVTVSGTPFGTAGYAIMELTQLFPEDQLQRMLQPDVGAMPVNEYVRKLIVQGREVVASDFPRMGGNWIWALFLTGLLVPFRNVALGRSRWLVVLMLVALIPVQALGKTQHAIDSPDVNLENLLVLVSPLVLIFGVSAFFVLADSLLASAPGVRYTAWVGFIGVLSLPLGLAVLPPHPQPLVYPPYFPPFLQRLGRLMDNGNMIMSDIPAAVAWYGQRQAVLLTPSWADDFIEIQTFHKPVNALYLSSKTVDKAPLGPWLRGNTNSWHGLVVELKSRSEVPAGFPLRSGVDYFSRGQVLLMDFDRTQRLGK